MTIKLGKYKLLVINRNGQTEKWWSRSSNWELTRYKPILGFYFFVYEWDQNSGN